MIAPWVPVSKELLRRVVRDAARPVSRDLAFVSVALDLDEGQEVSVAGYASLWGWGWDRVRRFLQSIGASIEYPAATSQRQNQRGRIVVSVGSEVSGLSLIRSGAGRSNVEKSGTYGAKQGEGRSQGDAGEIPGRSKAEKSTTYERHQGDTGEIPGRSARTTRTLHTDTIPYVEIVGHLNRMTGRQYRVASAATKRLILARWREGFRLEDFHRVIDGRVAAWKDDKKMSEFLRPATLFSEKFENYLAVTPEANPNHQAAAEGIAPPPPREDLPDYVLQLAAREKANAGS